MLFPHIIAIGNATTTFSGCNLHIIATATEVSVLSRCKVSAASAPGTFQSQTHLLIMNHIAQTCCTRNLITGRLGINYLLQATSTVLYVLI